MSALRAPHKTTGEILAETLNQTVTLARRLAELLEQVARLATALRTHQARMVKRECELSGGWWRAG
jgi:hypothetical protein